MLSFFLFTAGLIDGFLISIAHRRPGQATFSLLQIQHWLFWQSTTTISVWHTESKTTTTTSNETNQRKIIQPTTCSFGSTPRLTKACREAKQQYFWSETCNVRAPQLLTKTYGIRMRCVLCMKLFVLNIFTNGRETRKQATCTYCLHGLTTTEGTVHGTVEVLCASGGGQQISWREKEIAGDREGRCGWWCCKQSKWCGVTAAADAAGEHFFSSFLVSFSCFFSGLPYFVSLLSAYTDLFSIGFMTFTFTIDQNELFPIYLYLTWIRL